MKMLQPSLAGGEMAPGLHGRVDLARYPVSLATCRNVVTRPTGGGEKRPGFIFRGEVKDSADATRILPFIYSTEVRYLIEAGDLYFRFWYLDANNALAAVESSPGVIAEIATEYTAADLEQLRTTQSADVLYLVHPNHKPRELRRLTASTFELRDYANRFGPFRPLNTNAGVRAAVSAQTGEVTVTVNADVFTEDMVGALFYVEEPELRSIPPWEPGISGILVGTKRRSDGKVYQVSAIPQVTPPVYWVTGGVRPVHEEGRAWDGSLDARFDSVNYYHVGVEWEYLHSGFGIVELTEFVSETTMLGTVRSFIPDACVGTAAATHTWTFSGDGSTTAFSIPGATATNVRDYAVVIDGEGVPY